MSCIRGLLFRRSLIYLDVVVVAVADVVDEGVYYCVVGDVDCLLRCCSPILRGY